MAEKFADGATYQRPGEELEALMKKSAELDARIAAAEARWLEAAAALEEA